MCNSETSWTQFSPNETLIHFVGSFAAIAPPMRGGSTPPLAPFQHNSISRFILQARSYLVRPPEFPRRPRIIRHLPSYNNGTEGLASPPPPPPPARECQSTGIGWYFQQLCNFLGIVGGSRELLLPTTPIVRECGYEGREGGWMAETIHYRAVRVAIRTLPARVLLSFHEDSSAPNHGLSFRRDNSMWSSKIQHYMLVSPNA